MTAVLTSGFHVSHSLPQEVRWKFRLKSKSHLDYSRLRSLRRSQLVYLYHLPPCPQRPERHHHPRKQRIHLRPWWWVRQRSPLFSEGQVWDWNGAGVGAAEADGALRHSGVRRCSEGYRAEGVY